MNSNSVSMIINYEKGLIIIIKNPHYILTRILKINFMIKEPQNHSVGFKFSH